jgi:hypothetical protein
MTMPKLDTTNILENKWKSIRMKMPQILALKTHSSFDFLEFNINSLIKGCQKIQSIHLD